MIELKKDQFDSEIFRQEVFRFALSGPITVDQLRHAFEAKKIDLLFCVSDFDYGAIRALEEAYFKFINIRNTYKLHKDVLRGERVASKLPGKLEASVIKHSVGKTIFSDGSIVKMASIIGSASRYFQDQLISRQNAEAIYVAWLKNSLYNGYADEVFTIATSTQELAGFISLKIKNGYGHIDLIGVHDEYQNKGLGGVLMAKAVEYFNSRNIKEIYVATEGENIKANIFYQRKGFVIDRVQLVYHKHF